MLVPEKTYKNRQNYRASNDPPGIGISVNVPTPAKIEEKVHSVIKILVSFQRDLVCFVLQISPHSLFYRINFLFPLSWWNILGKPWQKTVHLHWTKVYSALELHPLFCKFCKGEEKGTKLHWSNVGVYNIMGRIRTWRTSPTLGNGQIKTEALSQLVQLDVSSLPMLGTYAGLHHSWNAVDLLCCQWLGMSRKSLQQPAQLHSPLQITYPVFSWSCLAVAHAATKTVGAPAIGKASYCSTNPSQRHNKLTVMHMKRKAVTPSKGDEPPEELPFWEEGNYQESVEVQSLHEKPAVVRHNAILKEDHGKLASSLRKQRIINFCLCLHLFSNRV